MISEILQAIGKEACSRKLQATAANSVSRLPGLTKKLLISKKIFTQTVKADKFLAGSQTCNACGYKNHETKNLSIRVWDCPECGIHHDRDINAAISIRNEGMQLIAV